MLAALAAVWTWAVFIRYLPDITRLATMSDDAFVRRSKELQAHPNVEFRALCAVRWTHVMYPGEPRWKYRVVAFQKWGANKDRYTRFDDTLDAIPEVEPQKAV